MSLSKFPLGTVTTTFFANLALQRSGQKASDFLNQHKNCKWGEITPEERYQNDEIVKSKEKCNKQILSAYTTTFHENIWIITKFEKNSITTTILLPREFESLVKK